MKFRITDQGIKFSKEINQAGSRTGWFSQM
jgi:hypothetical protein